MLISGTIECTLRTKCRPRRDTKKPTTNIAMLGIGFKWIKTIIQRRKSSQPDCSTTFTEPDHSTALSPLLCHQKHFNHPVLTAQPYRKQWNPTSRELLTYSSPEFRMVLIQLTIRALGAPRAIHYSISSCQLQPLESSEFPLRLL